MRTSKSRPAPPRGLFFGGRQAALENFLREFQSKRPSLEAIFTDSRSSRAVPVTLRGVIDPQVSRRDAGTAYFSEGPASSLGPVYVYTPLSSEYGLLGCAQSPVPYPLDVTLDLALARVLEFFNPAKSNRPENAVVLMGFDGPGSSPEQIGFIAARIEQARIPLAQRNGIVYAYAGPAPPTGLAPSASCEFPVFAFSRKKIPGHFPPPGVSPPPRGFLGM